MVLNGLVLFSSGASLDFDLLHKDLFSIKRLLGITLVGSYPGLLSGVSVVIIEIGASIFVGKLIGIEI